MDSKEIKVIDEMRLRLEQIASGIFKQYELYNVFLDVHMKKEIKNDVELKEFQNELCIEHRDLTLEFLKCLWKDPKWRNEGLNVGESLLGCGRAYLDYSNALIWNLKNKSDCEVNFRKRKKDFQDSFSEYRTNLNNRINRLGEKHEDYYELVKAFSNDEVVIEQIEWEVLQDE